MPRMENTERLFLGLHLDELFHAEISAAAEKLKLLFPSHKWVKFRHFHFTVHFLGDTTLTQKERVVKLARDIARATQPFQIALENMGAFPSLQKPRVIWIGAARECQESLALLYKNVTRPFISEGFPVEHEKFTPHATLFRVRAEAPIVWNEEIFSFPKTSSKKIGRMMLFKSILGPEGSEYQPIEEFSFG